MLQYNNCTVTNSTEWLGVAAGVRWADCAQGAGQACVLGVQGAHGRLTCMGRAGVAGSRRWDAQQMSGGARRRAAAGRAGERQAERRSSGGRRAGRPRQGRGRRAADALGARPVRAGWAKLEFCAL